MNPFILRALLAAGSRGSLTLSYVTANKESTGSTIKVPNTAAAGDLAVLVDWKTATAGTPTAVTPSGWTNIVNASGVNSRLMISAKLVVLADVGATQTCMSGDSSNRMILAVFRGSRAIGAFASGSATGEVAATNLAAQTVAASGVQTPLVVLAAYGTTDTSPTGKTFSPTQDGSESIETKLELRYKIYNTAPADVSVDFNNGTSATNALGALYLRVS